jgi:hypothetical protein
MSYDFIHAFLFFLPIGVILGAIIDNYFGDKL